MRSSEVVKNGIVKKVTASGAEVEIGCATDACSACKVEAFCGSKDSVTVIASTEGTVDTTVGDAVSMTGSVDDWYGGWMWIAGIPIILIVAGVAIGRAFDWSDALSGLAALGLIAAYYLILKFMSQKLENKVKWTITKKIYK